MSAQFENNIFLIEKMGVISCLMIIGLPIQLTVSFGTALVCNTISKASTSPHTFNL